MYHLTDRVSHTTAFVTPVVEHWLEREMLQWVHHEGSIRRSIAPRANGLTTELHLASDPLGSTDRHGQTDNHRVTSHGDKFSMKNMLRQKVTHIHKNKNTRQQQRYSISQVMNYLYL